MQPEYCQQLIRDCKDKRFGIVDEEQEQKAIVVTEEWAAELKQFKQFARSKGRMVHLLAQKSKVGIASKPRKKYKPWTPADHAKAKMELERQALQASQSMAKSQAQPQASKKITPTLTQKYDQPMGK